MADERYNIFRSTVHWRYAMGKPYLAFFDARLIFFVALFLFHIRWWTFVALILAIAVFTVANQLNYSLESLWRLFRSRIVGQRRPAVPYTRLRPMVEYGAARGVISSFQGSSNTLVTNLKLTIELLLWFLHACKNAICEKKTGQFLSAPPHIERDFRICVQYLCKSSRTVLLTLGNDSARESAMADSSMSGSLEQFLQDLSRGLDRTMVSVNKELTMRDRIKRSWSMRQCAKFLNVSHQHLTKLAKDHDDFPSGNYVGRERVFTLTELMHMRALLAGTGKRPYEYLAWRKPEDPLPVISFASQKGGTAKSLSAAHFAQYLSLHYGMRVGIMDADPQSTITLYFVGGEEMPTLPTDETPTMVDFAGLFQTTEDAPYTDYDADTLDTFFKKTSWPGVRLLPAHGETSEGEIQIARLLRMETPGKRFYRFLKDAIDRWKDGHVPSTAPSELLTDGKVDNKKLEAALSETLDCIIIDYQPALTLFQLNNVIASTSLIIPQTMKGFDIATLSTFVTGLLTMLRHIFANDRLDIGSGANMLLPTIVQRTNEQDLNQVSNLLENCPGEVLPVFYLRSDSIANASDVYQSVYEYEPDTPGKKKGINRFIENADAVNDAIVSRLWPGLERGYADQWIKEFYDYGEDAE